MIIDLFRQGLSAQEIAYYLIIFLFERTLSFSFHEFMHAAVAVWLGDPTPRNMGRLTLNPIAHVDPVGTILLLLAGFGWGKPVMYNPRNLHRFKSHRWMNIMVHLAGVTGNFFLALISNILFIIFASLSVRFPGASLGLNAVADAFSYTYAFSMMLLAFNLLPIPPLDGFHVLEIMKEKKLLDIPVIIITAESTEENLQKTLPYCIRDFICKPFKPDAILKRLKTMYHLAW